MSDSEEVPNETRRFYGAWQTHPREGESAYGNLA